MIMLGGAFYYSTKEDLAELFKQSLEEELEDKDKWKKNINKRKKEKKKYSGQM